MSDQNPEVDQSAEGQSPKSEEVNQRLLEESKKYKAQLKDAKAALAELETFKNQKLEEEGNYKKLLDQANEKLLAKEKESKELRQKTLRSNIVSTISKLAGDVYDLEDVLNQPAFKKHIEDGIDEESLTLSEDAAKKYLDALFEKKPHLKKPSTKIETHKGGKPGYAPKETKPVDISKMTTEELQNHIMGLAEKGLLK